MRPSSLLGILFDLLEELARQDALPADARVGRFFRDRRYLGAGDRRAISGLAYAWLRLRPRGEARWDAWAPGAGLPRAGEIGGRERPLAALIALSRDGLLPWSFAELATAARGLLDPSAAPWAAALDLAGAPHAFGPDAWPADPRERLAAELALPPWVAERFLEERGEEEARRLGALLLGEAPVDLRVNLSRVSREEALAALAPAAGPGLAPTPLSPLGIRLPSRKNLSSFQSSHAGWIEVQDEGSQLVVLAADPGPRDVVLEPCAGAGGKTLATLDLQRSRGGGGSVHAADISPHRLEELRRRAAAMGAAGLSVHALEPEGPLPGGLPAGADLVLIDAPCSGTGALRRSPELKYRYGPGDLARFASLQLSILERFAPRVRPGGRLVYATCSLFREENDDVTDRFLRASPAFVEEASEWAARSLARALDGARLRLDPLRTGTDGFFVATMRRSPQ